MPHTKTSDNSRIVKGYFFSSEEDVNLAIEKVNKHYNIFNHPDKVTNSWVSCNVTKYNDPRYYYIIWHESLNPILGEPTEIELILL